MVNPISSIAQTAITATPQNLPKLADENLFLHSTKTSFQTNTPLLNETALPTQLPDTCPQVISDDAPSLLPKGTLYFGIGDYHRPDLNGIWTYQNGKTDRIYKENIDLIYPERMLGVSWGDNLSTYQFGNNVIKTNYELERSVSRFFSYTRDGFFFTYYDEEHYPYNIEQVINLQPLSGNKFKLNTIQLPDLMFYGGMMPEGFVTFANDRKLVLYSALIEGKDYVVLYDYEKKQELWKIQKIWHLLQPIWAEDGKRIFMPLYDDQFQNASIYRLDIDTLNFIDLTLNSPQFKNLATRFEFNVSPMQRYLYLGTGYSNIYCPGYPPKENAGSLVYFSGPGLILDTQTNQVHNVYVPGKLFHNGIWINEHIFVYTEYSGNTDSGQNGSLYPDEIWVLDTNGWKTQRIYRLKGNNQKTLTGIKTIYGWKGEK